MEKPERSREQNTTITLTVDTEKLAKGPDTFAVFTDNRGDTQTVNPKEFTSIINKNYMIYWSAVGKNNIGDVQITGIELYGENDKILKDKESKGKNDNNWQWEAKVKNNNETETEVVAKYKITFKVDSEVFTIDPKLRIPPSTPGI